MGTLSDNIYIRIRIKTKIIQIWLMVKVRVDSNGDEHQRRLTLI